MDNILSNHKTASKFYYDVFLGVTDLDEITKMLQEEVKVKKSKELKNAIGF